MKLEKTARELLKYTLWADRKALAAAKVVRPEDLVREAGTSFGSLLGTLGHILAAERMWLSRFVGNPLPQLPSEADYPDFETLMMGFQELWPEIEFFLASLSENQLEADLVWTNSRGETHCRTLFQAVLHLSNHSSYHRGQVVTLLRQLGYEPPSTDLIYFLGESSGAD